VVPKSAIPWIIPGADFGTTNHPRKQCFASVLIDSEVRKAADPGMANFRIGTPERLHLEWKPLWLIFIERFH
jgi:hypothetical protein